MNRKRKGDRAQDSLLAAGVLRTESRRPGSRAEAPAWTRKLWVAYLAVGITASIAYFFAPQGLGHHLIYLCLGLSSVAAILYGIRLYQPSHARTIWLLFAMGQLGFVIADGIRAFYEIALGVPSPFPGIADVAYIAAYPLLTAGLILLVRSRDKVKDRANLIDAMIIVTSAGLLSWVYLISPYSSNPDLGWLEMAISIAYPLMDMLLLAMAAHLMFSPGVRTTAYQLLCASLAALLAADSFYTVALLNETYHTGLLLDAGWLLSYTFWGAAALHPSMRDMSKPVADRELRITRQRLLVLASASLLAPFVRLLEIVRGNPIHPSTTVIPTVILFVLVMIRMSGLVQTLSTALERHQDAERRRRQSEARFGSLVQHASDVVTVVDRAGAITFQSPSVKRVLGYGREQLVGRDLAELIHEHDRAATLSILEGVSAHRSDDPASVQFRCRHSDGSWRNVEATLTNLLEDPTVGGVVLNARDVTEQTALQDQLAHQAFHDPLTNLANRALFRDRVERTLDRRSARDEPTAVLFLDVDNFKTINDSLGHSAGDELLVILADRIRSCVRGGDTAARLGGDEFAVLLEDTKKAEEVATRITDVLAAPFVIDGKEVFITGSIGISVSELAQGGADELLRNADAAMYAAKSDGKGRSVVFRPDMHLRALKRLDLEADLRRAIERNEFRLHYQPLVEVQTGRISGFEALVRWVHPERGLVGPAEFISVAEDTGLIRPIGRWVVSEAVRQLRAWEVRHPHQPLTMSVNLSAGELAATGLVSEIQRALAESSLAPERLVLEMTERILMTDTAATMAKLEELRGLGVRLSVDDFGTGFSSLSYLRSFPIDSLKIAKPFLDGICESDQEAALVRGIIDLGHNLDLQVVAEGVERPEQWHALQEMSCDLVQGYLLARPQGAERVETLLQGASPPEMASPAGAFGTLSPEGVMGLGALGLGPAAA